MADRTTTIRVKGDTEDAERKLRAFGQRIGDFSQRLTDRLATGFSIDIAGRMMNFLQRIPQAMASLVRTGVAFNTTLEGSAIGLASILRTAAPEKFGTLTDALSKAQELTRGLKEEARLTLSTYEELIEASRGLLAPYLSAGGALDKFPSFVATMSRAVTTAMPNAPGYQVLQEGRALLTGNVGPDALLAQYLEINGEQIKMAKQQGRLIEFLTQKMSGFDEASKAAMNTLSGITSNLRDELQIALGNAMQGTTEKFKLLGKAMQEFVASPEFGRLAEMLGRAGGRAADYAASSTRWAARNSGFLDLATLGPEILATMPLAGLGGLVEKGPKGFFQSSLDQAWKLIDDRMSRLYAEVFDKAIDPAGIVDKLATAVLMPNGSHKAEDKDGQAAAKVAVDDREALNTALASASKGVGRMRVPQSEHGLYFTVGGSQAARDMQNTQRLMMLDIRRIREKLDRADLDINHLKL